MIDKNEIQTHIHFLKTTPENFENIMLKEGCSDWSAAINNNYFIKGSQYLTFHCVLSDMGISLVSPDQLLQNPKPANCYYEIRLTGRQFITFLPFPKEQTESIRYDLYSDAWYGLGNIFSKQMHPKSPCGINFTEKIKESGDPSLKNFLVAQLKEDSETDAVKLIELLPYVESQKLVQGHKISDYQIRLFYDDPHEHFEDLVSAFIFINSKLCEPFELVIEKE